MSEDPARPWLLAIDTASDQAGVALFDGELLAERSWPGGRRQTVSVLPEVEQLCLQVGIGLSDVAAVAVSLGPGSFTGLRVGLGLAKGLVLANDCVLIGVPTLEVLAAPWRAAAVPAVLVVPAGRSRVVWASFDGGELSAPLNTDFDGLLEYVAAHQGQVVAGELSSDQRTSIADHGGNLAPVVAGYRRVGALAEIAIGRWQQGKIDDPVNLEPLYLHGRPNHRP